MSFFKNIFGKKTVPQASAGPGAYLGDLNKTAVLYELFKTPAQSRDQNWTEQYYSTVAEASFCAGNPQVIIGPDGFPYFVLHLPQPNKQFQCYVIKHMIEQFLFTNGTGIVIEPKNGQPEWVFSYGDVVHFHIHKTFKLPLVDNPTPKGHSVEVIKKEEQVLVGQPSEELYPKIARQALRKFLAQLGISDPKIFLMQRSKNDASTQEIVFNFSEESIGSKEKFDYVMLSASWHLPRNCKFASMSPDTSLRDSFQDL